MTQIISQLPTISLKQSHWLRSAYQFNREQQPATNPTMQSEFIKFHLQKSCLPISANLVTLVKNSPKRQIHLLTQTIHPFVGRLLHCVTVQYLHLFMVQLCHYVCEQNICCCCIVLFFFSNKFKIPRIMRILLRQLKVVYHHFEYCVLLAMRQLIGDILKLQYIQNVCLKPRSSTPRSASNPLILHLIL